MSPRRVASVQAGILALGIGLALSPLGAGAQSPRDDTTQARLLSGAPSAANDTTRQPWSALPDTARLLYHSLDYGSDAYFSPVTVLLNKGFDIFQLRNSPRNVWDFPYANAWEHGIKDVIRYPAPSINRFGGWGRFLRVEVLPLSPYLTQLNWFVNYTEHFTVGGLTMRGLDEWYRARGVPLPRLWAVLTTYSASVLNEISEQPDARGPGAGGVADLLIFDVAAVLLWHWDQPTRFFAKTLQAADWSDLATFTFPNRELQNNGQYLTLKVPIGLERTRLFVRGGMGAQFGLSRKLDAEHHVSAGLGIDTEVRDVDKAGFETVGFAFGSGLYYDRNNSLLWSLTSSPAENLVALNVYPGVLPGVAKGLGVWAIYTRHGAFSLGVVHRRALGLGLGLGW